jgi:hypothetical protein
LPAPYVSIVAPGTDRYPLFTGSASLLPPNPSSPEDFYIGYLWFSMVKICRGKGFLFPEKWKCLPKRHRGPKRIVRIGKAVLVKENKIGWV